jgi:hypothetical protein
VGEKEIRPGPVVGGSTVSTTPKPGIPQSVERPGTGGSLDESLREMGFGGIADALKAASDAESAAAAKGIAYESPPLKGGWRVGRDPDGTGYAKDPDGNRGNWNGKQFVDPKNGKPFPANWGKGLVP